MPDFRCFFDDSLPQEGERITLSREESNHLVAANRARKGSPVRLFNGSGTEWDAVLLNPDKRAATLEISKTHHFKKPQVEIALAQAVPKGKLMESIIRKATEIGASRIIPVLSQNTEVKIDPKKEDAKNAKWTAATLEGAKQSGNPFLAQIESLQEYRSFLTATSKYDLKLIASLAPGAATLSLHLQNFAGKPPQSIVWLVGPEGDFTESETEKAINAGFLPTVLGPHVMRCETAAVYALSIAQYEMGKMDYLPSR